QMKTISFQPLIAATSLAGFWERWRTWRCSEVSLALVLLAAAPTQVLATEDIKKDVVGPWEVEATFKNDKFEHCAIRRNVDKVLVLRAASEQPMRCSSKEQAPRFACR